MIREALQADQRAVSRLIQTGSQVHRHLDWRNPLDWIGLPPFKLLEQDGRIIAALGCPPEPPSIAWLRLFANAGDMPVEQTWKHLWEETSSELRQKGQFTVAAICVKEWLIELLQDSGFSCRQHILLLSRNTSISPAQSPSPDVSIRSMLAYDLPQVAEIDHQAFDPLWRNPLSVLTFAYPQAAYATVAELDGAMVGYQLSTGNYYGFHLARLAIRPGLQGRGIGAALISNLLLHMERKGVQHLTVNTQSDNSASLALYRKMEFHETGDRYAVFTLEISGKNGIPSPLPG